MFVELLALALLTSGSPDLSDGSEQNGAPSPDLVQSEDVTPHEWSRLCEPWDDWDKPAAPFKITHNVYYVGTCGISAVLITGDAGHVLIDTGTRQGAEVVESNVRRLGIDPARIGLILYSHEHFDHVGGMAAMQRATGAPVLSAPQAWRTFRTGQPNSADPQYGMHDLMEPAPNSIRIEPETPIQYGDVTFLPIATPGHSPGALSWQWMTCEYETCKVVVYADSLSPISRDGYKFSDRPEYLAEYRAGIERVRGLNCDILLTPHPSHSRMVKRAATGTLEGGMSCADYADSKTKALDDRLAKEAAGQ